MRMTNYILLLFCSVGLLCPEVASGVPILLSSQGSNVSVSPEAWYGVDSWVVDGRDWTGSLNFWFRRDTDAEEKPFGGTQPAFSSPLVLIDSTQSMANVLSLDYAASDSDPFSATVDYELNGNPLGSGTSDLDVTVTLTNDDTEELILHLFYYADFSGRNHGDDDIGQIIGGDQGRITDGTQFAATDVSLMPDHYQVDWYNNILEDQLSVGGPALLNDNAGPVGPTSVAYAFQWDLSIASGDSVSIDVSHHIGMIPEPSTWALMLTASLLFGIKPLRRKLRSLRSLRVDSNHV